MNSDHFHCVSPGPPPLRRPRAAPAPLPCQAHTPKRTPRRPSPFVRPRLTTAHLCGAWQAHHRRLLVWLCGACALRGAAAAPARALSLGRARAAQQPIRAGRRLPDATHARAVAGGKRGLRPNPWAGHARWPRVCGSLGPGGSGAYTAEGLASCLAGSHRSWCHTLAGRRPRGGAKACGLRCAGAVPDARLAVRLERLAATMLRRGAFRASCAAAPHRPPARDKPVLPVMSTRVYVIPSLTIHINGG